MLERMREEEFYGAPLDLKAQKEADESFGFIVLVAGGVLRLRPVQHFGHADLCRSQCSSWSMSICVAMAAGGAC